MMKIKRVERHSERELIDCLRRVSMLEAPEVKPYESAFISLERLRLDHIWPSQSYVLRSEFEKVRTLRWSLLDCGIDMFDLEGYLTIFMEESEEPLNLLPPVVEESIESDGSLIPLINDGMHRMYLAWKEWVVPRVAYVRGVPKAFPYYAYPLRGGWQEIKLIEDRDDLGILKKYHRTRNNKGLYRNFNSAFQNVGGPRGKKSIT